MIKVKEGTLELNGEIPMVLAEFTLAGMNIKKILANLEDEEVKTIFLNEFQTDLIKMYKYNSPEEFMEADERQEDINIRELFGLED